MEASEGLGPMATAGRNGRPRRPLRILGSGLVVLALLIAAGAALGVGPPGEPSTIHVFGRDYQRYHPCCEAAGYFGHGPNSMKWVKVFMGMDPGDPVIVHLESFPLGWPLGFADPVTGQESSSLLVWLQEGPDAYFPYGSGGTDP